MKAVATLKPMVVAFAVLRVADSDIIPFVFYYCYYLLVLFSIRPKVRYRELFLFIIIVVLILRILAGHGRKRRCAYRRQQFHDYGGAAPTAHPPPESV